MGRTLAFSLLERGHQVTLFDRDPVQEGGAAAYAAAGMLAPLAELESAEHDIYRLGRRSLRLWPGLIDRLAADVDYHRLGSLVVAHGADGAGFREFHRRLSNQLPQQERENLCLLQGEALALEEPDLADRFGEALWLKGEAWLDTRKLMTALADYLPGSGARWHATTPVESLAPGVIRTGHEDHCFDVVVDCRGLGARDAIPGLRGVRGEILWLDAPQVRVNRPVRLIHPRYRLYLVPRQGNRYVLGATQIESDDSGPVTVRSSLELLSAAYSLHDGFSEARVVHMEANCRPALDDNRPRLIAGDRLLRINGLFRHGYLLAPALAELATDWLENPNPVDSGHDVLFSFDNEEAHD
jgi:glycine oxidase